MVGIPVIIWCFEYVDWGSLTDGFCLGLFGFSYILWGYIFIFSLGICGVFGWVWFGGWICCLGWL
jgi:hypothetical protein